MITKVNSDSTQTNSITKNTNEETNSNKKIRQIPVPPKGSYKGSKNNIDPAKYQQRYATITSLAMSDSNDEMYDWSKASKSKLGAGNGQISISSRIKSKNS